MFVLILIGFPQAGVEYGEELSFRACAVPLVLMTANVMVIMMRSNGRKAEGARRNRESIDGVERSPCLTCTNSDLHS